MAIQTINLGSYANDGTGDDLRTAFQKVNANLIELYSTVYGANVGTVPPTSGVEEGELWWSTVEGKLYIYYGTAWIESTPVPEPVLYDISATVATGGANIHLNGSNNDSDDVKIASGTNITVTRTDANTITLSSTSYTGDVTGNLTGNVTGDVTGNLTGNAGSVTNGVYTSSSINALADVNTVSTTPTLGQALVWNGTNWIPGSVSSEAVSNNFNFGTFNKVFTDPVSYLLDAVGVNLGTFTVPAAYTIDLGTF
jgi:hypothetical protein